MTGMTQRRSLVAALETNQRMAVVGAGGIVAGVVGMAGVADVDRCVVGVVVVVEHCYTHNYHYCLAVRDRTVVGSCAAVVGVVVGRCCRHYQRCVFGVAHVESTVHGGGTPNGSLSTGRRCTTHPAPQVGF